MTVDEMELVRRLGRVEPLTDEALEQARAVLKDAIAIELSPQVPLARPDRHRRPWRTKAAGGIVAIGIAAAATAVAVITTSGTQPPTTSSRAAANAPARQPPPDAPLVHLADYLVAHPVPPAGDATLVIRRETYASGQQASGADLYTDSGAYYYAPTESGLPAQVAAGDSRGNGAAAREVAAAKYAVNGDLATARTMMEDAALGHSPNTPTPGAPTQTRPPVVTPNGATPVQPGPGVNVNSDNLIWENSLGALVAGAGNPHVRAGVLRILATLPTITVTDTNTNGQPTLNLAAGAAEMPADYQETLVINASTGIPIDLLGGAPGHSPDVTVSYQVSRVTLSDIAAGKY